MKKSLLIGSLTLVLLGACSTLEKTAPPVSPEMIGVGQAHGISAESLVAGRRLLAMRCTNCHSLEPIEKFSAPQWIEIVQKMAKRSGVSDDQKRQITDYLTTARSSL